MAKTGKIVEVLFEQALETYEHQMQMLSLVERFQPDSGDMQNSGTGGQNTGAFGGGAVWRPYQQHSPIIEGWDMTGLETEIVEETYPAILTPPKNDIIKQTADDLRDMQFWKRRGEQSGKRQATELNSVIANAIALQGSLFYEYDLSDNANSGFKAIATAQALLNERQANKGDSRFVVLNDRDNLTFGDQLAGRQTLQGRPADTWATGQIGSNVAEFDVYTGSFLPTLAASAGTEAITGLLGASLSTSGDSFIPEAGSVDASTGAVTNVDCRVGKLGVAATAGFAVGDKVNVTGCNAVGLADKSDSGQLMTFTVVAVDTDVSISVYPKPILANLVDTNEPDLYPAYGNCTGALIGQTINALNVTGGKQNIFGCKGSVEVTSGDAPIELLNEFGGMKVISSTMSNGQKMYMAYDGSLLDMSFTCRLFTWYGVTVANPQGCGSFTTKA